MEGKLILFEENAMLGGYSLAVRDNWVYKIKRVHVTDSEKELYEKKFGDEIITYDEFFDWWCRVNRFGKYSGTEIDNKTPKNF